MFSFFWLKTGSTDGYEVERNVESMSLRETQASPDDAYVWTGNTMAPGVEESASAFSLSVVESGRERQAAAAGLLATLAEVQRKKQSVDETMATLLREMRLVRLHRQRRKTLILLLTTVFVFLLYFSWSHIYGWYWIFNLCGGAWVVDSASNARKDAARALEKAGDPRAVGVLAVALRDGDAPMRRLAETALLKLLPNVQASHAGFLDNDQVSALLAIGEQEDAALKVALLRALEQIGDSRAIPIVEQLLTDNWKMVRNQAAQCLPFLRERERRARESATLLRASDRNAAVSSAHLLRPAIDSRQDTKSDELLRPS